MNALYQPVSTGPILQASAEVYTRLHRLAKWSRRISVACSPCLKTGAQLLRRALPDWSQEQHLANCRYHQARVRRLDAIWAQVWKRAFAEAHGRLPRFEDYRITAIGSEDIAEHHKRVLRHCAYQATTHARLAHTHGRLAGVSIGKLRNAVGG